MHAYVSDGRKEEWPLKTGKVCDCLVDVCVQQVSEYLLFLFHKREKD